MLGAGTGPPAHSQCHSRCAYSARHASLLRYAERLVTHAATFRALADLRVWFFRNLARGTAGGLGFRQAGDVLARLVGDIEALDGLYLAHSGAARGCCSAVAGIGCADRACTAPGWLSRSVSCSSRRHSPCLWSALARPCVGCRARRCRGRPCASPRSTHSTGLREVRAFGAEGRMLASVQAREATHAHDAARTRRSCRVGQCRRVAGGQAAILALLISAGSAPMVAIIAAFLTVAAFEAVGGLPRAGVLAGHAAAAARRVLEAAEAPVPVPDPQQSSPGSRRFCVALRRGQLPLAA